MSGASRSADSHSIFYFLEKIVVLFNTHEWENFRRSLYRKPWFGIRYGFQLALLVLRRIRNSVYLRLVKEPHLGMKERPEWIDGRGLKLPAGVESPMHFPEYALTSIENGNGRARVSYFQAREDDPEAYFARNRWGECLAAVLTGEGAAIEAAQHAMAWIKDAPERSDLAWEPYSSCERVVNLAVLLAARPECRSEIDVQACRDFFADSLLWIDGRLEYYGMSRTNNHILNNARGLVVAGAVLDCTLAVERGLVIFAHMARVLFRQGGFLRERSSHYQIVVANWLFDVLHFARQSRDKSVLAIQVLAELEELSGRVARATGLLIDYVNQGGALIGDISPDVHPQLSIARLRCLYAGAMEEQPDTPVICLDDWLFAKQGSNALLACGLPPSYPAHYTTHGHEDFGSFIWTRDRKPVLVDAGRTDYLSGATSGFQCGPIGHNCMMINGLAPLAESLLLNGRWLPEPYSSAHITVGLIPSGIRLEHTGFSRIAKVGKHIRIVHMRDDEVVVEDHIEGAAEIALEMFWHFPPGFAPADKTSIAGEAFSVTVVASGMSGEQPDHAWRPYPFAAAYGDEQMAHMLSLTWLVKLPYSIKTVFRVTSCAA